MSAVEGLPASLVLLRDAPIGAALLDAEGRFAWVNPALASRFGLTPEDFEKNTPQQVLPGVLAA
ncbi:MAG: PAS domain-containing protein, partial [Streptosporangiaceae bacterium]